MVGFLVAANPLGEAYITTFGDFCAQIKQDRAADVNLSVDDGHHVRFLRGSKDDNTISGIHEREQTRKRSSRLAWYDSEYDEDPSDQEKDRGGKAKYYTDEMNERMSTER